MNTVPKITPEHVAAQVVGVQYHRFPGTTVTVCCVSLRNGFNTIGHSACVSPELYDAAIGEQIAYKNALNEIWQLEGYLLAEFLTVQQAGIQAPEGGGIKPAPQGHTAYAAAPRNPPETNDERVLEPTAAWPFPDFGGKKMASGPLEASDGIVSGGGGDFAGAGASGSWEAPTPSACPAPAPSDPPAASAGESCGSGI